MEKCLPRLERCHGSLKGDAAQIRAARRESVRQQFKSKQLINHKPHQTEAKVISLNIQVLLVFLKTEVLFYELRELMKYNEMLSIT